MKVLVKNYTFDKATRKITLLNFTNIKLEQLLLITNVTTNTIIYNFADSSMGATVSKNVITLSYNTTSMSNTDSLQIFIDLEVTEYQEDILDMLLNLMRTTTYARDAGDRMRVIMDNNPMLYNYMRNSSTNMNGSTEAWYSNGSHTTVDAREQLKAITDSALIQSMQKWRVY